MYSCLGPFHPSSHCAVPRPSLIRLWLLRSDVQSTNWFTHSLSHSLRASYQLKVRECSWVRGAWLVRVTEGIKHEPSVLYQTRSKLNDMHIPLLYLSTGHTYRHLGEFSSLIRLSNGLYCAGKSLRAVRCHIIQFIQDLTKMYSQGRGLLRHYILPPNSPGIFVNDVTGKSGCDQQTLWTCIWHLLKYPCQLQKIV